MQENIENLIARLPELLLTYGIKILLALLVFIIGKKIAQWLSGLIGKAMLQRGVDSTVASFTRHISYYVMLIVVLVAALGQLGLQTASFVAVIGAAGLAIGFALQGSLSNFAAGVLLILFRPFKGGDYIEAGGTAGVVKELTLFTTTLFSPDNRTITVPNGAILGDNIINYSTQLERRVDLVIRVSYQSDIDQVRREILSVVQADDRILKDREVTIAVMELAESSINFVVRPWVSTADFWPVRFDLLENIKKRFDEAGIEIPFPQMDIHMDRLKNSRKETEAA